MYIPTVPTGDWMLMVMVWGISLPLSFASLPFSVTGRPILIPRSSYCTLPYAVMLDNSVWYMIVRKMMWRYTRPSK